MPPIKTFEDYWNLLVGEEDNLWWDQIKVRHARKDIRGVAHEAFIDLCAQAERLKAADVTDFRKHLSKFLMYAKDQVTRPQLQQEEVNKKPKGPQEPPLTGEARMAKIKEFVDILQKGENFGRMPLIDGQVEELGKVDPPKPKGHLYPSTPAEYQKQIDDKVRKGRAIWFRDNHPNATEQEIEKYLNSFENGNN